MEIIARASENVRPPEQLTVTTERRRNCGFRAAFTSNWNLQGLKRDPETMTKCCPHCRALHLLSERRSISSKDSPKWESCCKEGDVVLPSWRESPGLLRDLLTEQTQRDRNFRQHIRKYNSALTFTSCNYKPNARIDPRVNSGPVSFQIHGKLYHLQGPLHPLPHNEPAFAQLYFYDPDDANARRLNRHSELNADLLRQLTDMLYECNPFISLYKTADELLRTHENTNENLQIVLNPQMRLIMQEGADRRRWNLPTSNEIAAIIPYEHGDACVRDIVFDSSP